MTRCYLPDKEIAGKSPNLHTHTQHHAWTERANESSTVDRIKRSTTTTRKNDDHKHLFIDHITQIVLSKANECLHILPISQTWVQSSNPRDRWLDDSRLERSIAGEWVIAWRREIATRLGRIYICLCVANLMFICPSAIGTPWCCTRHYYGQDNGIVNDRSQVYSTSFPICALEWKLLFWVSVLCRVTAMFYPVHSVYVICGALSQQWDKLPDCSKSGPLYALRGNTTEKSANIHWTNELHIDRLPFLATRHATLECFSEYRFITATAAQCLTFICMF